MTAHVRWLPCLVLVALSGCYASHRRDGDADAGAHDAGVPTDGAAIDAPIGPPCSELVAMPCVVPDGEGALDALLAGEALIQALVIAADDAHVLFRHLAYAPAGMSVTTWETATFDAAMRVASRATLDTRAESEQGLGAAVRLDTGELHFAWRVDIRDSRGRMTAAVTHQARRATDDSIVALPEVDRDPVDELGQGLGLATTDDGSLVFARMTARGLALRSDTREGSAPVEVLTDSGLVVAPLASGRVVVIVREQTTTTSPVRSTAIVFDSAFEVQARATVFEGAYADDSLVVLGDDVYVARFERRFDRLDASRLRPLVDRGHSVDLHLDTSCLPHAPSQATTDDPFLG